MTAEELRSHFNRVFGIQKQWPKTYEVDAETYANCCQFVFSKKIEDWENQMYEYGGSAYHELKISVGLHGGLMFKGVELIYKRS